MPLSIINNEMEAFTMRKFLGFIFSMSVIFGSLAMGYNTFISSCPNTSTYNYTKTTTNTGNNTTYNKTPISTGKTTTATTPTPTATPTAAPTTAPTATATPTPAPDMREAHYTGTPNYQTFYYSWISNKGQELNFSLSLDVNAYTYYSGLERYLSAKDLYRYAKDDTSIQIAKEIANTFKTSLPALGYSDREIVEEAINFVQQCFTYEYDTAKGQSEYPKYLIETMVDRTGDCEDTSLLLCSIVKQLGYGAVLLDYPGHIAVGLQFGQDTNQTGRYYDYNGKRYYYIETTNTGWDIGQMPQEYIGQTVEIRFIY